MDCIWSDYLKYKAELRKFSLDEIEKIVKYSKERYFDTNTQRLIVIGKHDNRLVMIPCEMQENSIIPITIHATTRQQINFRVKTGRFVYE